MYSCLAEARLEQVTVKAVHTAEVEAFCRRNNIPFEVQSHSDEEAVYLIRAGRDYTDAQLMVYKMRWGGNTEEAVDINNAIRELAFTYFYWKPEYEYELTLGQRDHADEMMIRGAVGW